LPTEPSTKRVVAFVDAQNLFHAAKEAFGYRHPNFDPIRLATGVCQGRHWDLTETRLYTGVPAASDDTFWNHFWTAKLAQMGREGVVTYSRALRYRQRVYDVALVFSQDQDLSEVADEIRYESCIDSRDYRPKASS
jgi:hypothetical protein